MKKVLRKLRKVQCSKGALYWLVQTMPFSSFYKILYKKRIEQRLKNFKISDLYISIEPYNLCNARCFMCPYQKMTRPKVKMSMEFYRKIIDDCLANGIKSLNLNFHNEPFIDDLVFERIRYAKSRGMKVAMYSNGSLMNQNIIGQILDSGIDVIDFSFDGFSKKTYEEIRVNLNFEKTRDNILNLINERNRRGLLKPGINMIFVKSKKNFHEVKDFNNFWKDKADSVGFSLDDNRNETYNISQAVKKRNVTYPCRKLWTELIVMSNGKVCLCCLDFDGKTILGDFNHQSLKEIWGNEQFKRIRELHLNFQLANVSKCKNCLHPYRFNSWSWY